MVKLLVTKVNEDFSCIIENQEVAKAKNAKEYDVEYCEWLGKFYLSDHLPIKPVETMQAEVRLVRNSYLEKYVDPKQLVMVWDSLSADDKKLYADYRTYLLDYTEVEDWYLQNPMTLDEWKNPLKPVVDTVNDIVNVTEEPLVELSEASEDVVELYSMEI